MFDQLEQTIRDVRSKNDISLEELKAMGEMYDIIKDIKTTCAMDESSYDDEMAHGYDMPSYYDRTRMPYYDPTYTDGMIMHNRNGYSVNMRTGMNGGNYNKSGMNRSGSSMYHSNGTDHSRTRMMNHLEQMLDSAETEEERKMITKWMNEA